MSKSKKSDAEEAKRKMSTKKKLIIIFSSVIGLIAILGILIYIFLGSFLYTFFPDIYVSYSLKHTSEVLTKDIDQLTDSILNFELSNDKDYTVEYTKKSRLTSINTTIAYAGSQQKLSADFNTEGILNGIDGKITLDNYEIGLYSPVITGENYFSASAPEFGKEFNKSKKDGTAATLLYGVNVPENTDISFSNLFGTETKKASGKSDTSTKNLADTARNVIESGEVVHTGKTTVTLDGKKRNARVVEIEYRSKEFADSYKELTKKLISDNAPLESVEKLPIGGKNISEWLDVSADEVTDAYKTKQKIKVKYTIYNDTVIGIDISYNKDKSISVYSSDSDNMIDSWEFTKHTSKDNIFSAKAQGNIIPDEDKIKYTLHFADNKDTNDITLTANLDTGIFDYKNEYLMKDGKSVSEKDEIKGKCKTGDELSIESEEEKFSLSVKPGAEYKGMDGHNKYEIFEKNLFELALTFGSRLFG